MSTETSFPGKGLYSHIPPGWASLAPLSSLWLPASPFSSTVTGLRRTLWRITLASRSLSCQLLPGSLSIVLRSVLPAYVPIVSVIDSDLWNDSFFALPVLTYGLAVSWKGRSPNRRSLPEPYGDAFSTGYFEISRICIQMHFRSGSSLLVVAIACVHNSLVDYYYAIHTCTVCLIPKVSSTIYS